MANSKWEVVRFSISTDSDIEALKEELNEKESDKWDLKFMAMTDGKLLLVYYKK